jgi:hypothetical protein
MAWHTMSAEPPGPPRWRRRSSRWAP